MRVLVTGGAGFIGSHIAQDWLSEGHEVVVLDNLSTGFADNLFENAESIEGSVEDLDTVRRAADGVELVFHLAASRAVLRSVEDPIGTDRANTAGTLNLLVAARDAGAQRVVLASSSSIYGGVAPVPTPETAPLAPKSPYAVSKLASEHYARVFFELYGLETVALRYFNVFGPHQRPDSPYAAVIPLFIEALSSESPPQIHGDGKQSRDFTYVDDAVTANRLAATAPADVVAGEVYNIARGDSTTILEIFDLLNKLMGVEVEPVFVSPRPGDIRISRADVSKAREHLKFNSSRSIGDGLSESVSWFESGRTTSRLTERNDLR